MVLLAKRLLPRVLLFLGGRVEAEVKLPAPLGVAGQGRHHPLAGGARRLEQPYCRHTSGELLGEVTQRRSIHLSSGSTETRQVTPGGCLGLGPASGSGPSLPPGQLPDPVPAPTEGPGRALGRGSGGLGSSVKMEHILLSLSEPRSFPQWGTYSACVLSWAVSGQQRERWAWPLPPGSPQARRL